MRWWAASLAVLAIGTAACDSSSAGMPNPAQSATTSAEPSLPSRPRELPLDDVDPCKLLAEQQRAQFGIDRPPSGSPQPGGPLKDSPTCSYRSSGRHYGFLIVSSTAIGLDDYLEMIKDNDSRRTLIVGGFPGIQDQQPSSTGPGNDACFVDLDVADGQLLEVQSSQVAADPDKVLPMETLCAKAVEVAEAALTTLQGQR